MTSERTCFIISPIDKEGSATRQHADDVYDYIICPAMEECSIRALRSDHLLEPGRISEQMLREITHSDCCVVLLSGFNPNVFYELAIAQCAGTPVVIMLDEDQELPFDVKDLRCIHYNLKPRSLFEKKHANELIAHLRGLAAANWTTTPLLNDLAPSQLIAKAGLPAELIEELKTPFDVKREALSVTQRQILFRIEEACRSDCCLNTDDLASALQLPPLAAEVYYRLEHLRLLGFIEKKRDRLTQKFVYSLSAGYRDG